MTPVGSGRAVPSLAWLDSLPVAGPVVPPSESAWHSRGRDPASPPRLPRRIEPAPPQRLPAGPPTQDPCTAGRITVPPIEILRLIGLNRNNQTCDLKRRRGFYRFSR